MEDIRYNNLFLAMSQNDEMKEAYDNYLESHISNVKKSFEWLVTNLPELFDGYDIEFIREQISRHDDSKYDTEEYFAYCEYFYGDYKNSKKTLNDFNYAWLHHQHHNPHHWQHWLLREDDGKTKALEMPFNYLIEMISDHWSFSWAKNNLYEIFEWYESNKHKMLLHPKTQKLYESILDSISTKL